MFRSGQNDIQQQITHHRQPLILSQGRANAGLLHQRQEQNCKLAVSQKQTYLKVTT